jgi:trimeric autotransporter adhesin
MRVPGVYFLDYRKVDAHGNTGSVTRTISVVDTTAPSMTLSGSTPMTVAHGSIFSDPGATWTDIVDGSGSVTAFSGTVNMNSV